MSDEEVSERTTFGVTPPGGLDSPMFRGWMQEQAESKGWTELEWSDEVDQHGHHMARLTGIRP